MTELPTKNGKESWTPMVVREGSDYITELRKRTKEISILLNSGDKGRIEYEKLELLGKMLTEALNSTGLDPTEFAILAGVDEKKMLFAKAGLLRPSEFLEEGFLSKIDEGLKKHPKVKASLHNKAKELLSPK